ncbi:MAG: hypothetical protein NVSMB22_12770 [Chloroflexota bacterium]
MRLLPLLGLVFLLAACASSALYTQQDLVQVRQSWTEIGPVYKNFKRAYMHHDDASLRYWYAQEQTRCKLVDVIDKRDTIDPNIKLFQASADVVDLCNDMEGVWAFWRRAHGLSYDKALLPASLFYNWQDGDLDIKKVPGLLRHPNELA